MKHFSLLLALLIACATALPAAAQQQPDASHLPESTPDWHPTFAAALEAAQVSNKKVLVDIYAPWCPWCRRLINEVYTARPIQDYLREHFEVVRLNGELIDDKHQYMGYTLTSAELAQGLGASGYPTTVFLGPDGQYITRLPGFAGADDFIQILRYIGSDAYTSQSYDDFVKASQRPSGGR